MLAGAIAVLGALVAAAIVWSVGIERVRFTLRRHELAVLPVGHRPVRVLHLSDMHMAPWQRRKQSWVASLAAEQPDLIVSTGDVLGHARGISGVRAALEPFRGIPGVFVNGSNDYFGPQLKNPLGYLFGPSRAPREPNRLDTAVLTSWFAELGWHDLNNAAASFTVGDTQFGCVGVDDPHLERDDLARVSDSRVTLGAADCRLGVSHAPYRRVLDAMTTHGMDLIFAGHTHGGQVCLPRLLGGAIVTNCDLPRAYASGLHRWIVANWASALNVSAGIGTSIFAPIRVFCRPEASLITLVARA